MELYQNKQMQGKEPFLKKIIKFLIFFTLVFLFQNKEYINAEPVDELNNVMSYNIELIGQNHVGIINKLSHVLADELEANVEELKTEIIDASMSGEQLFKAQINLHLPNSLDENLIRDKLEQIADEMMVEIYSYES